MLIAKGLVGVPKVPAPKEHQANVSRLLYRTVWLATVPGEKKLLSMALRLSTWALLLSPSTN